MSYNVLIVDDQDAIRDVLRMRLEQSGHSVCEAANGVEALRALQTIPFDLIITDILMPEMDGLEAIRRIRREQPQVPIIAISAPSNQLYLESAAGLGANRVFTKPFELAAVALAVDELLAARAKPAP